MLFDEVAELTGQRNAIDGRLVEIVAEIEHHELAGIAGARSLPALVAWKLGTSPRNAETIAAIAHRIAEFPRCTDGLREDRLSVDQVGVSAERAATGSDAAVASHRDGQIADWKLHHAEGSSEQAPPPCPTTVDAFMALVEAGWDTEAARRPHGQHTTVLVHVDVEQRLAGLHLGPLLCDADRQYLLCDATCEVWFERHGRVVGSGRATRTISRRLRRALEHRDRCAVPGCGATRGLQAHHLQHWEDGGPTELTNLVLLCPYHGPLTTVRDPIDVGSKGAVPE